jgi:hypothetical protein
MRCFPRSRSLRGALIALAFALNGEAPADARTLAATVAELDQLPPPHTNYTVPNEPNMLFYLQRSKNANTIVYAANMTASGQIDPKNPVEVFWRVFDEDGRRHGLNFIERTLAYGAAQRPVADHPGEFDVNIVSLPEVKFRIDVDESGRPEATLMFGNRTVRAISAYVEIDETGLIPELVSLDIYGIDKASGRVLHERMLPR